MATKQDRRGRPKGDKRARTREKLLDAARDLIREQGFERTTLRDIGKPGKPNRHSPERFVELLTQVLRADPDVVVLHQGPPGAARGQLGDARIAEAIARRPPPLVVCGHCHWAEPLASVAGTTVLNADGRAVLLVPATEDGAPSPPAVDG